MGSRAVLSRPKATFNPLTAVAWTHSFWTEDPLWTPPADGATAQTWRNNTGGGDLTQATAANRPTYRAAPTGWNSHPALEFDGTNDSYSVNITDIAQPYQLVLAFKLLAEPAANTYLIGTGTTTHGVYRRNSSDSWSYYAGGAGECHGGTANTSTHILHLVSNGNTNSAIALDGSLIAAAGNPGTTGLTVLWVGQANGSGSFANVQVAFLGIIGDGTTDLTTVVTGLRTYYATA